MHRTCVRALAPFVDPERVAPRGSRPCGALMARRIESAELTAERAADFSPEFYRGPFEGSSISHAFERTVAAIASKHGVRGALCAVDWYVIARYPTGVNSSHAVLITLIDSWKIGP